MVKKSTENHWKSQKGWWYNRSSTQKGLIIGTLFGAIYALLSRDPLGTSFYFIPGLTSILTPVIFFNWIFLIGDSWPPSITNYLLAMFAFVVYFAMLGTIIGFILRKISIKKWWVKQSLAIKGSFYGAILSLVLTSTLFSVNDPFLIFLILIFPVIPLWSILEYFFNSDFAFALAAFLTYSILGMIIGKIIILRSKKR